MIFFDQFKVPTIEFGKGFEVFMIPIALLKKFGSTVKNLLRLLKSVICEDALTKRIS